jgi:hypothetical protein
MQDFSKEDFNFLNIGHYVSKGAADLIDLEAEKGGKHGKKLDDAGDLYKWHFNNIGINLL